MMAAIQMHREEVLLHLRQVARPSAKLLADTRRMNVGDVFMAYAVGHGNALRDGRLHITKALELGAACVLYQPNHDQAHSPAWELGIDDERCIAVENLSEEAGWIASEWYGKPSHALRVIGVTGTNGKTSVTQWLSQTLSKRAAVIGTLGVGFTNELYDMGYTTPDAPRLQTELFNLKQEGADYVALEVSSHALEQGRVNATHFDCAVFTNLSRDHLDYHGSMVEYGAVKAKLFKDFDLKNAVINIDDSFGRQLVMTLVHQQATIWTYSLDRSALLGLEKLHKRLKPIYFEEFNFVHDAYQCKVAIDGNSYSIDIPVLGEFNLSNALAVIATLLAEGLSITDALTQISQLQPVKGRMEIIKGGKTESPLMLVDYAHTPDALQKVLATLQPIAKLRQGQIYCVFGCGGDRDREKRPMMGKIAQTNADHVFVTSDNPRSEDPLQIMQMIARGMVSEGYEKGQNKSVEMIVDRAAAIMSAVRKAKPQDIVLVAGKGHETTQEVHGKRFDFSDQAHLRLVSGGAA